MNLEDQKNPMFNGGQRPDDEEALFLLTTYEKPRIYESQFITDFLPFINRQGINPEHQQELVGEMQRISKNPILKERGLSNNVINRWMEIVKNPCMELEVMDNATGELLFVVPPLISRELSPTINEKAEAAIFHVVMQASNQASILPAMGDRVIKEDALPLIRGAEGISKTSADLWNIIFKRYGLPLYGEELPSSGNTDGGTSSGNTETVFTEFDYE